MSAVLKSGSSAARVVSDEAVLRPSPAKDVIDGLMAKIEALESVVVSRNEEIDALHAEVEAAFHRGKAEGRQVGRREADDGEAARLQALQEAMRVAQDNHATALQSTERLALLLAQDALDLLFSEPACMADWIVRILRSQLDKIDRQSITHIVVSAADFSESLLDSMVHASGLGQIDVVRDAALPSGSCIIRQRLGEMQVGLTTQWPAIANLLGAMASEAETV